MADRFPEDRGRREMHARSGGRCEVSGWQATDASHRVRRGPGSWAPWNLVHLSHSLHMWLTAHPAHGRAGGWIIPAVDPDAHRVHDVPVWLWLPQYDPRPAWYVLRPGDDGGPHVVERADPEPDYCPLPPEGVIWPAPLQLP